ncbi:aminopeptidase M1-C isoform X1 [Brachypodium distachyon]|uniref:aminopeptidase M1-C isoform X1 n=1 Tax=Brachypodium distachyon TaxID=15368 RepID=UPI00052FF648|nr:aminopeptidase M1-C isoform X1 [Brachypodium distachyon]|eukprot:XP_003578027.2 aminopeptidase M1-C isoform X1 [Brachypodium distachyon]
MARPRAGAGLLVALLAFVVAAAAAAGGGGRKMASHGEGTDLKASPGAPAPAGGSAAQFRGQARLPRFATPRRYELRLRPDLVACTFTGSVAIAVVVSAPTRFLVLNAADLSVNRASIRFQSLAPTEVVFFKDDDVLVFGFSKQLPLGEGVLQMDYNGTLNDQMRGFYRSKYQYKGKERNMAVTQFESVDARRCFPCWDEPAFKAKFKLTVEVPSDLVALSNMPVANSTFAGPIKTVSFRESPLMSTYLLAVVVGLFDYVEGMTSKGTRVRVYTQIGKSNQGKFALDVAVKSLDLYKDYFDTAYPLPKLDMIAIPDFSAGAMENYGLVTYREVALLFDDKSSSESSKQNIAITVAHELAHQWFGNLVTMEWWTHLWLNEGFATWMSHLAVDSFFPQWNIWTQFLDGTTTALKLDALSESHPIEVEIHHASEVDQIFDAISYEKGASVIRMLQSYLGAERFQKALASYMKKFAYSNAKTEDLWAVLEKETGEPVKDLMTTWTKQKGYPVINAKIKGNDMEIEQAQFLSDGSSGPGTWIVPITSGCGYDTQKKFLLKLKRDKMVIPSQCSDRKKGGNFWTKLNINGTGFYRVKYDDELAAALLNALEAKKLSLMDRIGVVDDSHALSMARQQTMASLLRLLYAYRGETDYSVLSHVNSVTVSVARISVDATPSLAGDIKQLLIKILLPTAEKLGWDPKKGESHLDAMLRPLLLTALVQLGHGKTINEGIRRFNIFLRDRNTPLLPPDTRKTAYLSVMQNVSSSNRSGYDALRKVYRESAEGEERLNVLGILPSCRDKGIVLESLNFIFTDEVRNQDAYILLRGVQIEAREIAWNWLKENWERISKIFSTSSLLGDFVKTVVPLFTSNEKAAEISKFFATRTKPGFERTLKQSLENIRIGARWIEGIRSEPKLAQTVRELLGKP